jgi:hypothetical protein
MDAIVIIRAYYYFYYGQHSPWVSACEILDWWVDQNKMLASLDLLSLYTPHLVHDTWKLKSHFYDKETLASNTTQYSN